MESSKKHNERGGEFLLKATSCENIFTLEDFSEEQKMMRDSVQEFVEREIIPHKKRFEEHDYELTLSILKKSGKLGFLGVGVPEKYNGLEMGFVSTMVVCDYISGATGSVATAFGAQTGIGTLPITLYGTEDQKQKYVPKLATGEWIGAYALTEPGAGSDANSGKTKVELSEDKKDYLINGQKMWISNAGFANLFIVFARFEDDKNITGFIVEYDKDKPNGMTFGAEEKKLGIHSSSTRQVFFNDTKIPVENMLSERGNGFKIAMNALNTGRIKLAAACLDAQRHVITNAVKYANERVQFKAPIAKFGAIKSKLAEMATTAYICESATYRASKNIENRIESLQTEGKSHAESELKGVEDFAIECSLLKVSCSEAIQNCSDEGIQIFGGMGFSKDTPMEAAWRDARIPRIYEGTNEINRMLSVGMLLKKAMKGELDLLSSAKKVQDELTSIPSFEKPDYSTLFSEEKNIIGNLKKTFLMVAGSAVKKYGEKLEDHQQLLLASADILIEIYMSESGLLRAEKNAKRFGEDVQKEQIAMAKLYLYHAVEKINQKAKESIVSFASGDEQKMLLMGLKRFSKYQNYPNIVELRNTIAEKSTAENEYCF